MKLAITTPHAHTTFHTGWIPCHIALKCMNGLQNFGLNEIPIFESEL